MLKIPLSQVIAGLAFCAVFAVVEITEGASLPKLEKDLLDDGSAKHISADAIDKNELNEPLSATNRAWQVPIPFHRYVNTRNGDHFYTTFKSAEFDQQLSGWFYNYEGIEGKVYKSPAPGTVPLHRYYNNKSGDHFYTTNWGELGGGKGNYKYEGVECYVYPNPVDGTLPLYRYVGHSEHFYTTNWNELKDEGKGYKLEKIEGYIYPKN